MREINPPAIVIKTDSSLAELAQEINAQHDAGEAATRKGLTHFRAAGAKLIEAKAQCGHGKWLSWLRENVKFSEDTAQGYMRLARGWSEMEANTERVRYLRDALRLLTGGAGDSPADGDPKEKEYITLPEWEGLSEADRAAALADTSGDKKFNTQFTTAGENESIEWALWSWNPVTGCRHNCPYCYARDQANLHYEQQFEPSLWPPRLSAPFNTPYPHEKIEVARAEDTRASRATALGLGNVFTCSMADLFGRWVPSEWIEAVLSVVRRAPQWNFLFLTKFPIRMTEFNFPENAWVGTTVDCQARVANAEKAFKKIKAAVKWLSCEPLIEPLAFTDLGMFNWVVLGGASASTQTPAWMPPRSWLNAIYAKAEECRVEVYEKANAIERMRHYPGMEHSQPKQAPEALRYLPMVEPKR